MTTPLPFDNSYSRLPERLFARVAPTPVKAPKLVKLNVALARQLGLDPAWLASPTGVDMLGGVEVPPGAAPLAAAYAGHQFGHFNPQLGDGRAVLLGELVGLDGQRRDIQLKGAGPTPFSRAGDGRAALGPVLREYLVSETMAAFGIPTTRALAAVTTGDIVYRETPLPGAVLTRIAASHIRVGTFQFFAARGDTDALRALADHVIARHYPEVADAPQRYRALLGAIISRQATLVARWLLVGFVHGVMNTDNVSIAGETIDFGPCAFLDAYDPTVAFSSIDRQGRYAYGNQPRIANWNMARLAEAMLPLLDADEAAAIAAAEAAIATFSSNFVAAYHGALRRKLGLLTTRDADAALAADLLDLMAANRADFTLIFRGLRDLVAGAEAEPVRSRFIDPTAFDAWAVRWHARLAEEHEHDADRDASMRMANPAFIPRNHRVEAALEAAVERHDFRPFEDLLAVLSRPYDDQPEHDAYAEPPAPGGPAYTTFCGT